MSIDNLIKNVRPLSRNQMAWRAAQDVREGSYVNLGIGIPTLIADYIDPEDEVIFHSENGILGMGPAPLSGAEDPDLVNAGKTFITVLKGGAYFNTAESFSMMRGRHLDSVFMGAFQVSEKGDLANWRTDDMTQMPSVGGAMDLAVGCDNINILMKHSSPDGKPKILKSCTYPLTAKRVVKRIYTDLSVIDVAENGLYVREIVEGITFSDLEDLTEADLVLSEEWRYLVTPDI